MNVIEGNLLDIETGIIVHQVNCLGVMGKGLAAQIRARYPSVYKSYHKLCHSKLVEGREGELLGTVQLVSIKDAPPLRVANLFGQLKYGMSGVYTNYDAIQSGLEKIRLVNIKKLPVYIPFKIGAGLAGGEWEVIKSIIVDVIPESTIVIQPSVAATLGSSKRI